MRSESQLVAPTLCVVLPAGCLGSTQFREEGHLSHLARSTLVRS